MKVPLRSTRPGRGLVVTDVIRAVTETGKFCDVAQDIVSSQFAQKFSVASENADHRDRYGEKLRASGFHKVYVASISQQVFPGWHRVIREDPALMQRSPLTGRLPYQFLRQLDLKTIYATFDCMNAEAQTPL